MLKTTGLFIIYQNNLKEEPYEITGDIKCKILLQFQEFYLISGATSHILKSFL